MNTRSLAKFFQDDDGVVAILAAILLPIVISALALGAEAGHWYLARGELQQVADISVRTAALNIQAGQGPTTVRKDVLKIASDNGLKDAGSLTIFYPPSTGPYKGNKAFVEVSIDQERKRLFSAIVNPTPVEIGARAVARINDGDPVCVLALSKTAEPAIQIGTLAQIDLDDCAMASNSRAATSISQGFGSRINADCVQASGGAQLSSTTLNCGSPKDFERAVVDPYADHVSIGGSTLTCRQLKFTLAKPTNVHPMDEINGTRAMRICGGFKFSGTVGLASGIYIIDGGKLEADATAFVQGEGVTFVLRNGAAIDFTSLGALAISAPTTGALKGLLFVDENTSPSNTPHKIDGRTLAGSKGALYSPYSNVEMGSLSYSSRPCMQIIADEIKLSGFVNLKADCLPGMRKLAMGGNVILAE